MAKQLSPKICFGASGFLVHEDKILLIKQEAEYALEYAEKL